MLIRIKHKASKNIIKRNKVVEVKPEEVVELSRKYDVEILDHKVSSPKKGKSVVFYHDLIYEIGGIETFLYNISSFYKDYAITVVYNTGDIHQLLRLAPYVNLKKNDGNINCDILILNNYHLVSALDIPTIIYNEAYLTIHADFRGHLKLDPINFRPHPKLTGYISVSKAAYDGLKEVYGLESTIIYNFIDTDNFFKEDKHNKVLKLITLSRATREKGIDRIVKIAREFKKEGIRFIWFLCGTIDKQLDIETLNALKSIPEIVFVPPSTSNKFLIPMCDYVVQLSTVESYCYSMHEGLCYNKPIITTNYPEALEFIKDGVNGYILDMNLSNLDVHKIYNKIPKGAKYINKCDHNIWSRLFEGGGLSG